MQINAPLDYFLSAHGPAAQPTQILNWVFSGVMVTICIIIGALLLAAILRKRPHSGDKTLVHGGHGLRWIVIGTGISTAILFVLAAYSLIVLNQTAQMPKPGLTLEITGYDWWWKVEYPDFTTANEIHIPVGVPVLVKLKSADVIHAFWVPQLAGKTQMIPGLTNQQWLQADTPGIYHGKCTQFCGLQHAHMDFEVIAEDTEDFRKWQTGQARTASAVLAKADGQHIFMRECAGCHTIRGTDATGNHAPDLTHLQSRRMIASGMLENNPQNLQNWISHTQEIKPGAQMPETILTPEQNAALISYLETLK